MAVAVALRGQWGISLMIMIMIMTSVTQPRGRGCVTLVFLTETHVAVAVALRGRWGTKWRQNGDKGKRLLIGKKHNTLTTLA